MSSHGACMLRAGVIQMNVGIVLSFFNQRYFRDSLSTWCAILPARYIFPPSAEHLPEQSKADSAWQSVAAEPVVCTPMALAPCP